MPFGPTETLTQGAWSDHKAPKGEIVMARKVFDFVAAPEVR